MAIGSLKKFRRRGYPNAAVLCVDAELQPFPRGIAPSGPGFTSGQLFDSGQGHSLLTRSSLTYARRYFAREGVNVKAPSGKGTIYLGFNAGFQSLRTPYKAKSGAFVGNAVGQNGGDFYIGYWFEVGVAQAGTGTPRIDLSVCNAGITAAGTAFVMGRNSAGALYFSYSDGTTVATLTSKTANQFPTGGIYYAAVARYKSVLYLFLASAVSKGWDAITGAPPIARCVAFIPWAGNLNVPTSEVLSIGFSKTGQDTVSGMMDLVQMFRSAPFAYSDHQAPRQRFRLPSMFPPRASSIAAPLDGKTTGLWACFSMWRKLLTAYTGSCLRVRRSSDSTELDIGFSGPAMDLSALLAFVGSGNGFVTKVYDQNGGSSTLFMTTAASQPRIVNAGVYDGKIKFDGSDDSFYVSTMPSATAWTVFMRMADPGSGSSTYFDLGEPFGWSGTNKGFGLIYDVSGPYTRLLTGNGSGVGADRSAGATRPSALDVYAARFDIAQVTAAAQETYWKSTGQVSTAAGPNGGAIATGSWMSSTAHIGGRPGSPGSTFTALELYDVAVYNAAVSDANMSVYCAALKA